MKVYCKKCLEFTYHDFRKWPFCGPCRGRGSQFRVFMIQAGCIIAFAAMVAKVAGYL